MKHKVEPPGIVFRRSCDAHALISDTETGSQLHASSNHTHLLECYPPACTCYEIVLDTGLCRNPLQLPLSSIRVVPRGWCLTALLTNGPRLPSRFLPVVRCGTLRFSARSAGFLRKCSLRPCAVSNAMAWCNAQCIR